MTSLLSTFKSDAKLFACGIDSELTERFESLSRIKNRPSPLIFSEKEIDHCFSLSDPSAALCASFCCKEAVYKAFKEPYNFTDCELFWNPGQEKYHFTLSEELCSHYKIRENIALVEHPSNKECVVRVFLLS